MNDNTCPICNNQTEDIPEHYGEISSTYQLTECEKCKTTLESTFKTNDGGDKFFWKKSKIKLKYIKIH
ncbi:MAG: hypothetical protein KDC90_10830 [Ignavibacteriae bacterium]|nr:hypothetical protein [Ignavibacteriota bacterium]